MAVTFVSTPVDPSPKHNPLIIVVDSTEKAKLGFRYRIRAVDYFAGVLGEFQVAPRPVDFYGEIDISRLLTSVRKQEFKPSLNSYSLPVSFTGIIVDEEYYYSKIFADYEFAGSVGTWPNFSNGIINVGGFARTKLRLSSSHSFVIGDQIEIKQSTVLRPELEGIHQVIDTYSSGGSYYIILDLLWIGSGSTSAGDIYYADGNKTIFSGNSTSFEALEMAMPTEEFISYTNGTTYAPTSGVGKIMTTYNGSRLSKYKPSYFHIRNKNPDNLYCVIVIGSAKWRYAISSSDERRMFNFIPVGQYNEEWNGSSWVATITPPTLTGVDKFAVRVETNLGVLKFEQQDINLYTECDHYDKWEVTFLDRKGSYMTIPFNKGYTVAQNVKKTTYLQKLNTNTITSGRIDFDDQERGETTFQSSEEITYSLWSGQLSEEECEWYRELITSPQVFISHNGGVPKSALITNSNYAILKKRTARERKLNLMFKYANQQNVNI
jgi:hypothetical protein